MLSASLNSEWVKRSQMEEPFPSFLQLPSTWKAPVPTPQRNSLGKVSYKNSCVSLTGLKWESFFHTDLPSPASPVTILMKTNVQKVTIFSSRWPHIMPVYSASVKNQISCTDDEKIPFFHWSPCRADCLHLPQAAAVFYQSFTKSL